MYVAAVDTGDLVLDVRLFLSCQLPSYLRVHALYYSTSTAFPLFAYADLRFGGWQLSVLKQCGGIVEPAEPAEDNPHKPGFPRGALQPNEGTELAMELAMPGKQRPPWRCTSLCRCRHGLS